MIMSEPAPLDSNTQIDGEDTGWLTMFRTSEDYEDFARYIRRESRYVLDARQNEFLEAVVESSRKRTSTIPQGKVLWRAAQGYVDEEGVHPHDVFFLESIKPLAIERMKPLRDRAYEGRVNPKGVPCLYMATNAETAMMETRPWAGSVLTISQLVLLKQVTVVDCTLGATFDLDIKTQEQLESNSWRTVGSTRHSPGPVFQAEDVADYAPTQYIAEAELQLTAEGDMARVKSPSWPERRNFAKTSPIFVSIMSQRNLQKMSPSVLSPLLVRARRN